MKYKCDKCGFEQEQSHHCVTPYCDGKLVFVTITLQDDDKNASEEIFRWLNYDLGEGNNAVFKNKLAQIIANHRSEEMDELKEWKLAALAVSVAPATIDISTPEKFRTAQSYHANRLLDQIAQHKEETAAMQRKIKEMEEALKLAQQQLAVVRRFLPSHGSFGEEGISDFQNAQYAVKQALSHLSRGGSEE